MRSTQRDQDGRVTITGSVNTGGAVIAGTGFTVNRTGTGTYVVRFTPPFRALYTFNAQVRSGNTAPVITPYAADSVTVVTFATTTAALTDSSFSFTATGLAQ